MTELMVKRVAHAQFCCDRCGEPIKDGKTFYNRHFGVAKYMKEGENNVCFECMADDAAFISEQVVRDEVL